MRKLLCALLLACGCLGAPSPNIKVVGGHYSATEDEVDLNSSVVKTKTILKNVSAFLKKVSDLTSDRESLTTQQAMTMLPELVEEAVKLRAELDTTPVKTEDPEAVERVKDMVTSSLHKFAQRYDGQEEAITVISLVTELSKEVNTELPEEVNTELPKEVNTELPEEINTELPKEVNTELPEEVTEMPETLQETFIDEAEPETATILTPVESMPKQEEEEEGEEKERDDLFNKSPQITFPQQTSMRVPFVDHPFSNTQAFSFSNPLTNFVQGSQPIIRWLPSGGYSIYYNQGK